MIQLIKRGKNTGRITDSVIKIIIMRYTHTGPCLVASCLFSDIALSRLPWILRPLLCVEAAGNLCFLPGAAYQHGQGLFLRRKVQERSREKMTDVVAVPAITIIRLAARCY